ncbi:MAG: hypothetical protein ACKOW9_00090 [Candidatus Paceibacterota bacterium]
MGKRKIDRLGEKEEENAPQHGNYLQAFLVFVFIISTSAYLMLNTPKSTYEKPVKETLTEQETSTFQRVLTPEIDTLLQANRKEKISTLEKCLKRSVDLSSKIIPPDGMTLLATPNFPGDIGFGPIVVHQEIPGSAYLHLLYSATPLPSVGAVDPFAAPLIVDSQIQKKYDKETLALGVSTPVRGSIPANWLNENLLIIAECLSLNEKDRNTLSQVENSEENPLQLPVNTGTLISKNTANEQDKQKKSTPEKG